MILVIETPFCRCCHYWTWSRSCPRHSYWIATSNSFDFRLCLLLLEMLFSLWGKKTHWHRHWHLIACGIVITTIRKVIEIIVRLVCAISHANEELIWIWRSISTFHDWVAVDFFSIWWSLIDCFYRVGRYWNRRRSQWHQGFCWTTLWKQLSDVLVEAIIMPTFLLHETELGLRILLV